jgi:uncharacterized protein (DUF2252 family)
LHDVLGTISVNIRFPRLLALLKAPPWALAFRKSMTMKRKAVLPNHRARKLEKARDKKMARSASDFVRGSTDRFYDWLSSAKKGAVPEGPPVWICGDCHVGNLGPTANARGRFEVEIRDFDQTVIGNPVYDLIRLGLSLASAATVSDLPGLTIGEILESMIRCYRTAFSPGFEEERDLDEPETIRALNKQAKTATWTTLAEEDIENKRLVLPLGRKFWPLSRNERREIEALFESEDMRELAMIESKREENARLEIVDAAYWKKGCSSLGRLRYAVLLRIGSKDDDCKHCLMDLKEAAEALSPEGSRDIPRDPARRVIEGARRVSPFLGDRMRAVTLMGKPLFVREVLPQDLKIEIHRLDRQEAKRVAGYLAGVVGRAHARQMDERTRKGWRAALRRNRSKSLDAPNWLWLNVVDLLADHQRAYLDHCRRCAA